MIPPANRGGRPREVDVREVLNAILYVLCTGCQGQALPKDSLPKSTAYHYFLLWDWDGTLERIHHALYVALRERRRRCGKCRWARTDFFSRSAPTTKPSTCRMGAKSRLPAPESCPVRLMRRVRVRT